MSNYSELLQNPKWQKKRLEILERDKFTCRSCNADWKTLHVHHLYYDNKLKPWEYKEWDLITLCEDCHELLHLFEKSDFDMLYTNLVTTCILNHISDNLYKDIEERKKRNG